MLSYKSLNASGVVLMFTLLTLISLLFLEVCRGKRGGKSLVFDSLVVFLTSFYTPANTTSSYYG